MSTVHIIMLGIQEMTVFFSYLRNKFWTQNPRGGNCPLPPLALLATGYVWNVERV